MAKEITALELRKHFGAIIEEVRYRREPYIVKRNGRPMIVLLDIEAYQTVQERQREDAFLEAYTEERIQGFLKEDRLEQVTRTKARKLLE